MLGRFKSFKIWNSWNSFHNDIESIKSNLIKNAYPPFLIDKVIKKYLNYKFSSNQNQLKDTSDAQLKRTTKSFSPHPFTIAFVSLILFCLWFFFSAFLFHLLFSLSLILIIGIFYCFNYTSLLLCLITTYLGSYFIFHLLLFSLSLR